MQCLKGDLSWRRRPADDLFAANKIQIAGETPALQKSATHICNYFSCENNFSPGIIECDTTLPEFALDFYSIHS